jgi:hypothetical protein
MFIAVVFSFASEFVAISLKKIKSKRLEMKWDTQSHHITSHLLMILIYWVKNKKK